MRVYDYDDRRYLRRISDGRNPRSIIPRNPRNVIKRGFDWLENFGPLRVADDLYNTYNNVYNKRYKFDELMAGRKKGKSDNIRIERPRRVARRQIEAAKRHAADEEKTDKDSVDTDDVKTAEEPKTITTGPIMGKGIVSHNAQHCCVSLGSMKIPTFPFDHIDKNVLGPSNNRVLLRNYVITSGYEQVYFDHLGHTKLTSTVSVTPPLLNIDLAGMGLHDCEMMRNIYDKWANTSIDLTAFSLPTYQINANGVSDPNDMNSGVVVSNQLIEFKIKNITDTGQTGINSEGPAFVSIYAYQLKQDITASVGVAADSATQYPFMFEVQKGFEQQYDDVSGSMVNLPGTNQQQYGVGVMDNAFLKKQKFIGVQKHCLSAGQEGTFRAFIKKPQYYNFSHFGRAVGYGIGATDYLPVVHRKGEICFLIMLHGGLEGRADSGTSATQGIIQPAKILVHAMKRFEYRHVMKSEQTAKLSNTTFTGDAVTAEVDIEEHFSK